MLLGVGAFFGLSGGSNQEQTPASSLPGTVAADSLGAEIILPAPIAADPQAGLTEVEGTIQRDENFTA